MTDPRHQPKRRRRDRRRSVIPTRRWPRRILVTANVVVALCLIAAGGAYGYVRYRIDSIHTVAAPNLTASAGSGSPENILLIGNQTRAGLTNPAQIAQLGNPQLLSGSLSDVIMVLHLDPKTKTAAIVSIPRDLFAPMPAGSPVGSWQKIDAALNDGANGPNNLIKAIEQDFGIPINHYVELNFNGFENTVSALGGIDMYFPEPLFDRYSLLNIPTPGCVHLNGAEALALVRARHLQYDPPGDTAPRRDWPYDPESDLARIVRDHEFLRILFSTAVHEGLGNPITLNNFLGAVINQITIDPGLKGQLISLAETYRSLNPSAIPETTLPVTTVSNYHFDGIGMGDVDFPVQPADDQVIAAWDSSALPAPSPPSAVNVLNDTYTYDLAGQTAQQLGTDGLTPGSTGNGLHHNVPQETLVDYAPGQLAQAMAVMSKLSGAVMLNPDPSVPAGTVTVEAGTTFTVTAPPSTAQTTPSSATSTTGGKTASSSKSSAVPTVGGQTPSSSTDQLTPYDPRTCPAHSPVIKAGPPLE